jgi:hypothetical protein
LALNPLGEDSSWDVGALKLEFSEVQISWEIDLRVSGFEMSEIDIALSAPDEEDVLPELKRRGASFNGARRRLASWRTPTAPRLRTCP